MRTEGLSTALFLGEKEAVKKEDESRRRPFRAGGTRDARPLSETPGPLLMEPRMPTLLPTRRRFWRRYAPAPDTARNILATASEFGLALVVVAATVVILMNVDAEHLKALPLFYSGTLPTFGP